VHVAVFWTTVENTCCRKYYYYKNAEL